MSRLNFPKILTPVTPGVNRGELHYNNTRLPAQLSFVDEAGVVTRLAPATVKLTADMASVFHTSTYLVSITGLSFAVISGIYYRYKFGILWQTSNVLNGIVLKLNSGANIVWSASVRTQVAADSASAEFTGQLAGTSDTVTTSGAEVINTTYFSMLEGIILPSASGTIQPQYAAENSGSVIVVKQGSFGMMWEL